MVTITRKPAGSYNGVVVQRLICDGEGCGWEDKAYRYDAEARATLHIAVKHGGKGRIRRVE